MTKHFGKLWKFFFFYFFFFFQRSFFLFFFFGYPFFIHTHTHIHSYIYVFIFIYTTALPIFSPFFFLRIEVTKSGSGQIQLCQPRWSVYVYKNKKLNSSSL